MTMIQTLETVATTYARKNLDGPVQRLQIYLLAVLHVVMVLLLEVKNVTQSQVVSLVRLTLDSHALAMFARPHAAMVLRQVMRHVTTTILILEMAAMDHAKRKLDGSAQRQMTCQRVWPRVVMGVLQPSLEFRLPSSHSSDPVRMVSPHTMVHEDKSAVSEQVQPISS